MRLSNNLDRKLLFYFYVGVSVPVSVTVVVFLNSSLLRPAFYEFYRVDCGIIVCYIIKQLAEQKPVPTYLTVENLKKFRAELIHIFLNDKPRTWSTEEWKSNQLMRGMAI